jgi:hypothetical protein
MYDVNVIKRTVRCAPSTLCDQKMTMNIDHYDKAVQARWDWEPECAVRRVSIRSYGALFYRYNALQK